MVPCKLTSHPDCSPRRARFASTKSNPCHCTSELTALTRTGRTSSLVNLGIQGFRFKSTISSFYLGCKSKYFMENMVSEQYVIISVLRNLFPGFVFSDLSCSPLTFSTTLSLYLHTGRWTDSVWWDSSVLLRSTPGWFSVCQRSLKKPLRERASLSISAALFWGLNWKPLTGKTF